MTKNANFKIKTFPPKKKEKNNGEIIIESNYSENAINVAT